MEQELLTLPEHLSSPSVFGGVRVTRSLVLYVYFVDRCLSFCTFSFGHCVVFFFDIRILIAPLVSSNSSYIVEVISIPKESIDIWNNGKIWGFLWYLWNPMSNVLNYQSVIKISMHIIYYIKILNLMLNKRILEHWVLRCAKDGVNFQFIIFFICVAF